MEDSTSHCGCLSRSLTPKTPSTSSSRTWYLTNGFPPSSDSEFKGYASHRVCCANKMGRPINSVFDNTTGLSPLFDTDNTLKLVKPHSLRNKGSIARLDDGLKARNGQRRTCTHVVCTTITDQTISWNNLRIQTQVRVYVGFISRAGAGEMFRQ